MRYLVYAVLFTLIALFIVAIVPTVALGQQPGHSRRTPIVEAVAKTQGAILTLKVDKKAAYGRTTESVGTGVIVAEQGYAVTNNHVIAQAARIQAQLSDGQTITVKVIEQLPGQDLAILQLEAGRKYKWLPLGQSSDLMIGEEVIAIGNPFGYSNTVSRGIVSALNREIQVSPVDDKLTGLIQTDASINPGSSGGALVNVNGHLIGINVAMRENAQGIAFAIPAETVSQALARSLSAKRISGIDHGLLVAEKTAMEGSARPQVVVKDLAMRGLAAQAGIRPGDELMQVAGVLVANAFDVERAMWDCKPGSPLPLRVRTRDGQVREAVLQVPAKK